MSTSNKLTFRSIRARNFRSISNTWMELFYDKASTTLVASTDNGAGKSTLLVHALYYALFGKAYGKNNNMTQLVNSRNNKDTLVEVEFTTKGHDWLVRRGMKPGIFDILKDGERVVDEAALKDYQEYLLSVIGMDDKLFCNSVALGKDKFVPFASMTAGDRRNFVEQILDIVVFSEMDKINKERIKENNKLKDNVNWNITADETKVKEHDRIIALLTESINRKSTETKGQVETIKSDIEKQIETTKDNAKAAVASNTEHTAYQIRETKEKSVEQIAKLRADAEIKSKSIKDSVEVDRVNISSIRDNTINAWSAERDALIVKKTGLTDRLGIVTKDISSFSTTLVDDINKGKTMLGQFETKLKGFVDNKNHFVNMDDCPNCKQKLSQSVKDHTCAEMDPLIEQHTAAIAKLTAIVVEKTGLQKDLVTLTNEFNELTKQVEEITRRIETLDREIKQKQESSQLALDGLENNARQQVETLIENTDNQVTILESNAVTQVASIEANGVTQLNNIASNCVSTVKNLEAMLEKKLAELAALADTSADQAKLEKEQTDLVDAKKRVDEGKTEALRLMKIGQDMSDLASMLKDDGVKAQIVKQYIPFLNQKINDYLDSLNLYVNFTMDEEYNVEMFAPDRKGQGLGSLSTGQLTRIDLAVLLAWREVARMKASVDTNLLVLDEVLENLSEQGVSDYMDFWNEKFGDKGINLFVISQRKTEFQEYFDNTIVYSLKDGFTEQVE